MILTAHRTNKNPVLEWWRSVDRVMVSLFIVLVLAGMVLSMAASPNASAKLGISNPFYFFSWHRGQRRNAVDPFCRALIAALRICQARLYCLCCVDVCTPQTRYPVSGNGVCSGYIFAADYDADTPT